MAALSEVELSKTKGNAARRGRKRNQKREESILDAALALFGERGYENTTVAAICEAAGVSEATLYDYFTSKEQVLFSIAEQHTGGEFERLRGLAHFVHDPRERLRAIIQAYLEFYESHPLYTSVALLTLKANRNFIESSAYEVVREATRPIVEAFEAGKAAGLFRSDLDGRLVRNMVLGFIEHLTTQWIVVGRPASISAQRDTIHEMVMRAIEVPERNPITLRVEIEGASAQIIDTTAGGES